MAATKLLSLFGEQRSTLSNMPQLTASYQPNVDMSAFPINQEVANS
jgi:hypothetical protein